MKPTIVLLIVAFAIFVPEIKSYGHDNDSITESVNTARFSENKGQWNENVLYRLNFRTGVLFFEKNRLTYSFFNQHDWEQIYHAHDSDSADQTGKIRGHAFNVHFENCNPQLTSAGIEDFEDYENYYIGNDPAKWASDVPVYRQIRYQNLYPGIDLHYETSEGHLKYSYIVKPHSNPYQIKMRFEGVEGIYIQDGNLHYTTSVNSIQEQHLYAWQNINGHRIEIPCTFVLRDSTVSFQLARRYNPNHELVIDPVLVFSTYTGSTADNFGFTATYDNTGHLYAGGIVFGQQYPLTTGAYDVLYNGGNVDVSITKFTPDGSALVYSTFLGGAESENPSSIIVNDQNELIVLGTTSSSNFPTTVGAYDRTFNFGVGKNYPNNGPDFISGTDIFVCKFNATGSALVGSTFIGGSDNDGLNDNNLPGQYGVLVYNYGDQFRGEVVIDASGNIYAVSSTLSTNFPTTAGVFRPNSGGGQDAVVFKFNSSLTSLTWSSYLGGSGTDAGYNIATDIQNRVYVSGGTTSTNFPTTAGSLNPTYRGGRSDGYIVLISANANSIVNGTYIGTSEYDQSYFIDQDASGNIYVVGQTDGNYPVTSGVYTNANSGQYLSALTPNLTSMVFSTIFGRGDGDPDISPTAFLVDNCNNIYISGWAGQSLMDIVNFGAFTSTVQGMAVTSDAYRNTPDATGSDFYFIVFGRNAASLQYGSYFGSIQARDHVDGGTSRFDKNGIIYQAVCAGCGGFDDFPYTPGAWSDDNASLNCNEGLAKFEFQLIGVEVDVLATPFASGCTPLTVAFDGQPVNVIDFNWNFGDGTTSTLANPTHAFANPGVYDVTLIGIDSTTCAGLVFADTSTVRITVFANPIANAGQDDAICSGTTAQLTATGGSTYSWSNNQATQSINVSPQSTTTYTVTVTDANSCTASDNVTVQVRNNVSVQRSASICDGDSLLVGGEFQTGAGIYFDTLLAANGCDSIVSTNLFVLADTSIIQDITICDGDSFFAGGNYQNTSGQYFDTLIASDGCDSIIITNLLVLLNVETTIDAEICDGDGYFAGGNFQTISGTYYDTLIAANGCDSVVITNLTVNPNFTINVDVTICNEDSFFVGGANQNTSGIYFDTLLTSKGCDSVIVTNLTVLPLPVTTIDAEICDGDGYFAGGTFQTTSGTYFDTLTDANGCDSIIITNLTVNPNVVTNVDVTICNEDSFFVGGANQNTSGIYFDTLLTSKGCDSVIVTNLTVLPLPVTIIDAEICDGDGYFAGGTFQTTSGTYFDTLTDAHGCDSIIITNLTVNPNLITNVDVTICNEDFYFVGGGNQNTSGIYFDTLSTVEGCDSVIVTNLTVRPLPVTTIDAEICDGDGFFAGGNFQTESGTYFDTLTDVNGCDSTIVTNLTVNPTFITNIDVTICNEDSFFVGGGNQNTSGIYYDSLLTIEGCDSVIVTNFTVLPLVVTIIDTQVCDGTAYFAGGAFQTTSGTYFDTLKTSLACDSVIITNLIFSPALSLSFTVYDASCFGVCDASITISVVGGQSPLNFGWSNGDSTALIASLCVGAYDVTVTDANGCSASGSASVSEPSQLSVTVTHQGILCNCVNPINDFSICVIDFAGLPHGTILNEQYADQGIHISGDVVNSNTLDQVIVFSSSITGSPDPDLEVAIGNLAVLPENLIDANSDGLIDVPDDNASGGTQTFTFDQPRDIISFVFVDMDGNSAVARTYDAGNNLIKTVAIPSTGNGSVQTVMINANGVSKLVIDYLDSGGITEITLGCSFICCDGSASAIASGGTPPYNYEWSNGELVDSINSLCPGTYTLTVTDANGCEFLDSVTIVDFEELEINVTVEDISENCSASANHLCELDFNDLPAGTRLNEQYAQYGIHISGDAYGSFTDQIIIFDADATGTPDPDLETATGHLAIFPENLTDNNNNGLVDAPNDQGQGGKMTFTFDQAMEVISFVFVDKENNNPGTAKAYDANNALIKTVAIPNAGNGSVQTVNVNASGVRRLVLDYRDSGGVTDIRFGCTPVCCDGSATASVSGGNPPYTYQWSNGATTSSIDSLCPGTYSVSVTDEDSCQNIQSFDIFDCNLSISELTIVRERLGGDVATLTDGMIINLDTLCSFSIRADVCNSPNGSVQFLLNGSFFSIENSAPFAFAGDNPVGSYHPWTPALGEYTLVAIPYSDQNTTGEQGRPFIVDFTLVGSGCALKTAVSDVFEDGFNLSVYPVPFEEIFMIDLQVAKSVDGTLRVLDVIGRELVKQNVDLSSGMNTFTISLGSQIPEGIYFLEIQINGELRVVKVIKG